jgi:L-serine/L-threonine ammonia-lyase
MHIQTPLIPSRALSLKTGMSVALKVEALQPTGSFKIRGIGRVCQIHAEQGKTHLISSSGGNAGIAAAYAGRQLNIPVTVVVPETTTKRAIELIRQENAEVLVHGASWLEAHALAQSMQNENTAFIHPFDDPQMWTGHASMITEVVQAGHDFDAVVLAVGGGGLLSGVVEGLRMHGLEKIPVLAVETEGADALFQSVQVGAQVTLDRITSIATSLGAKQVCANAYELTKTHDIRCTRVTDHQALRACLQFLQDHRILVEPACGAALAALYEQGTALSQSFKAPLVIVCGGVTATHAQIQTWLEQTVS